MGGRALQTRITARHPSVTAADPAGSRRRAWEAGGGSSSAAPGASGAPPPPAAAWATGSRCPWPRCAGPSAGRPHTRARASGRPPVWLCGGCRTCGVASRHSGAESVRMSGTGCAPGNPTLRGVAQSHPAWWRARGTARCPPSGAGPGGLWHGRWSCREGGPTFHGMMPFVILRPASPRSIFRTSCRVFLSVLLVVAVAHHSRGLLVSTVEISHRRRPSSGVRSAGTLYVPVAVAPSPRR